MQHVHIIFWESRKRVYFVKINQYLFIEIVKLNIYIYIYISNSYENKYCYFKCFMQVCFREHIWELIV